MEITIGEELKERLSRRAAKRGFDGTEDYAVSILETVVTELEEIESTERDVTPDFDEDDEIFDRLQDLGYID